MPKTNSIKAIELTRKVFEFVHGNLGLLKFSVEELTPTNGSPTEESMKWKIICSFFESLGSSAPSRFEVMVDLNTNSVNFKKLEGPTHGDRDTGTFQVIETPRTDSQ